MNEIEKGLEWFVYKMPHVILEPLCFLDVKYVLMKQIREGVNILRKLTVLAELIACSFYFEPHISTRSTDMGVQSHKLVHVVDAISLRFESNIQ